MLIDASLGDTPGCVSIREVAPAPGPSWSHHLRPEDVVGLAHALFGAAPQVFLVTVTGAHFGYGEQLSPAVSDCMSRVLTIVEAALQSSPTALRSDGPQVALSSPYLRRAASKAAT